MSRKITEPIHVRIQEEGRGNSFREEQMMYTGLEWFKSVVKNYSTTYSRVVPHRSTDVAITSLTSEIERDPVLPGVYGRSWKYSFTLAYILELDVRGIARCCSPLLASDENAWPKILLLLWLKEVDTLLMYSMVRRVDQGFQLSFCYMRQYLLALMCAVMCAVMKAHWCLWSCRALFRKAGITIGLYNSFNESSTRRN